MRSSSGKLAAVFLVCVNLAIRLIVRDNYAEIYGGDPTEQFVLFVKSYEPELSS